MRTRFTRAITLGLAAVLTLAPIGCYGGDEAPAEEPAPAPAASDAATPAPDGE